MSAFIRPPLKVVYTFNPFVKRKKSVIKNTFQNESISFKTFMISNLKKFIKYNVNKNQMQLNKFYSFNLHDLKHYMVINCITCQSFLIKRIQFTLGHTSPKQYQM